MAFKKLRNQILNFNFMLIEKLNFGYNFRRNFLTMVTIFGIFLVVHILKKTYAEEDTFFSDLISTQIIVILLYSY